MERPIVTTGTFDGVHFGHRKIIDRLKSNCKLNFPSNINFAANANKMKIKIEIICKINKAPLNL